METKQNLEPYTFMSFEMFWGYNSGAMSCSYASWKIIIYRNVDLCVVCIVKIVHVVFC